MAIIFAFQAKDVGSTPITRSMSKKVRKFIFPGIALMASFYASIIFAIGAITGYIVTEIYCKKLLKTGKVRMLIFNLKGWEIHLHHWVLASLAILTAYLFNFIYSVPIIFLGILGGLIFHDIHTDKKWRKITDKAWYHIVYKNPR